MDMDVKSHPQAQLATGRATSNPVLAPMENSRSRYSSDPIATKLRKLISTATINIDKSVHIPDTEPLNRRLRVELPLGPETKSKEKLGLEHLTPKLGLQHT
jgi:hypothetical protein